MEDDKKDVFKPTPPAPAAPKAPDPEPVAPKTPDPEPVAPKHVRLESGTMKELMAHIKKWLEWDKRKV